MDQAEEIEIWKKKIDEMSNLDLLCFTLNKHHSPPINANAVTTSPAPSAPQAKSKGRWDTKNLYIR